MQVCCNSGALAMESLQSCTKPSNCPVDFIFSWKHVSHTAVVLLQCKIDWITGLEVMHGCNLLAPILPLSVVAVSHWNSQHSCMNLVVWEKYMNIVKTLSWPYGIDCSTFISLMLKHWFNYFISQVPFGCYERISQAILLILTISFYPLYSISNGWLLYSN